MDEMTVSEFNVRMSLLGWTYTEQCVNRLYAGKWTEAESNKTVAFIANPQSKGLARYWSRTASKSSLENHVCYSYTDIWEKINDI